MFVVKDNQPTLREEIELYVQNEEMDKCVQSELNGGRREKRTAYTTTNISWLTGREEWKNLSTIGAIHTQFTKTELPAVNGTTIYQVANSLQRNC